MLLHFIAVLHPTNIVEVYSLEQKKIDVNLLGMDEHFVQATS